jgi:hypothetical protein
MLSSLCRAIGPALGGVVLAWGMSQGVVGIVWWFYLTLVGLAGLAWSWTLKEGERPTMKRNREEGIEMGSSSERLLQEKDESK